MMEDLTHVQIEKECAVWSLTAKQAALRYGLRVEWFKWKRQVGGGPPYLKLEKRILYVVKDTDAWFRSHMIWT